MSSGRLPCTVTPTGRVCGTGMGMEWIHVTRLTSRSSTICTTARAKRSHCRSGSNPARNRNGLAEPVDEPVEGQAGRLVVLQMVLHEGDVRPPGTVIDELVGIEHGDAFGIEGVEELGRDLPDHVAGVGKTGESHHQIQPAQFGAVEQLNVFGIERVGVQQRAGNPFKHGEFLSWSEGLMSITLRSPAAFLGPLWRGSH